MKELFIDSQAGLGSNRLYKLFPASLMLCSLLLAWYIIGGFNLNFPISYNGDGFFMLWLIKRLMDGPWYFNSVYSGFPFESVFFDFPLSDSGNFLIIKFISFFSKNVILTFNIYLLLGFAITSLVSYAVLQELNVNKLYAFAGAILFTFIPFHFLRIVHLFYTFYFNVPIFFLISFKIFYNNSFFYNVTKKRKKMQPYLLLLILSSFGVYYTAFGVLLILASGLAGSLKCKKIQNIRTALLASFILILGIGINLAPNFLFFYKNGLNHMVVDRKAYETEVFGLKLIQMLLPQPLHRSDALRKITVRYNQTFPLVTENMTSSLGLIGSIGLVILLVVSIVSPFLWFSMDIRLQFFSFLTVVLFLFTTIGGFASLIALFITPLIRCWNRVSVFISFTSIAAFLLCAETFINRLINPLYLKPISFCIVILLLIFGIWDQTFLTNKENLNMLKKEYLSDQHFIKKIEHIIPNGSVYQLPYISFPEETINNNFWSYDLFRGYINSSSLHWSSGGMKGREGDLFFQELTKQPLIKQVNVIKKLKFNGIYIDRRGYADHGIAIEKKISSILGGQDKIISEDNNLVFFTIAT